MNLYVKYGIIGLSCLIMLQGSVVQAQPRMVKDINLYTDTGIGEIQMVGTQVFFTASDGIDGYELWRSNGTASGTVQVADIRAGSGSSLPNNMLEFDGDLIFAAASVGSQYELWRSDGSEANTLRLTPEGVQIPAAPTIQVFQGNNSLVKAGGQLYFIALGGIQQLWTSDGTPAGTRQIIPEGTLQFMSLSHLNSLNGKLVFFATSIDTSDNSILYSQLWESDGTAAGTRPITSPTPIPTPPTEALIVGNRMFYNFYDAGGRELWVTDGTTPGTYRVADLYPGLEGSNPSYFESMGGELFFIADDGVNGPGLWRSDGTAIGTSFIKAGEISGIGHGGMRAVNGTLFYSDYYGLWKSDGTPAGTEQVDFPFRFDIKDLNAAGNHLFFTAWDVNNLYGQELWVSNGLEAGTSMVADINTGPGLAFSNINAVHMAYTDNKLFFAADDGLHGQELWVLDLLQDDDGDCLSTSREFDLGTRIDTPDSDGDGAVDGADPFPTVHNINAVECAIPGPVLLIDRPVDSGEVFFCFNDLQITSQGDVRISSGAEAYFVAPSIALTPGFQVDAGGIFKTGSCPPP